MANLLSINSVFTSGQQTSMDELQKKVCGEFGKNLADIQIKFANDLVNTGKTIAFVCPQLPHPCELELWNECALKLGIEGYIYTNHSEDRAFAQFAKLLKNTKTPLYLSCFTMDTMPENKTFLSGLEKKLEQHSLVVCVGENSLASYQAAKLKRNAQIKIVLWQNAPRPPHANVNSRTLNGLPLPNLAREKTLRKEVLKNSDNVICFDKDGASWVYLEDVHSQRIRRISRSINTNRYSSEISSLKRIELRNSLGLPETDFIFFHLGPLEIESGALDSVYAFKNLMQSNPSFQGNARLCFCGSGNAATEIRQSVVELGLDDHVYFLNPNGEGLTEIAGNQFSCIISVCDAVIHAPIAPTNGNALKCLDSSYDILCALCSDIIVISNGHNWIGEWVGRFYKSFSSGSIHSLARLMQETIEKQDKLQNVKNAIKKAIKNEFSFGKTIQELVDCFKSLIQQVPNVDHENVTKLIHQIEELVISRQYIEAINYISVAFQRSNLSQVQQAHLFRLIGDCFTKLGDLDNGVSNYTRALEFDPYCAKCFIGLGTISLQRNNYNIAVPQFQKAVRLAPNDDMASLGLGLSFEGLKENQEALNWTVRACQLNPDNTVAIYNLIKLSSELERYLDAERILIRYLDLHPNDVNMIYTLGTIEYKTGKNEIAIQLMQNILALDPNNSRALSLLELIEKNKEQKLQA